MKWRAPIFLVVYSVCLFVTAGQSSPIIVWTKPSESLQWKTVMSENASISLDWPRNAVSADFEVECDGRKAVTNLTDQTEKALPVEFQFPDDERSERVLALRLTYKDEQGVEVCSQTARLGLVCGVAGTPTRCMTSMTLGKWASIKDSAVLPIPDDAESLTIDSTPVTPLDAPGWHFWKLGAAKSYALALTTASGTSDVVIRGRVSAGLIILIK